MPTNMRRAQMVAFPSAASQVRTSLLRIFVVVTCTDIKTAKRRLCYISKLMSLLRLGQILNLKF